MRKKLGIILSFILILGIYIFLSHRITTENPSTTQKPSIIKLKKNISMILMSTAFINNTTIPRKYTCDGEGTNPPLTFKDIPANTKSLALLVDDPDVPKNLKSDGVFDHWVVYNIEPQITEIRENSIPPGTQGLNGTGKIGYTPPCPPDREHRYFFNLYALDIILDFSNPGQVTKQMVFDKMQGHIIEQAELVGLYNRLYNK